MEPWSQEKCFSPECVLICLFKKPLPSDLGHWLQGKGNPQTATATIRLGTLITRKRFLDSMSSFVLLQTTTIRKWLGTLSTKKRFYSRMGSSVDLQIATTTKWFGTLVTRMGSPEWVSLWVFKLIPQLNELLHWSKEKVFSPSMGSFVLIPKGTLIKWF